MERPERRWRLRVAGSYTLRLTATSTIGTTVVNQKRAGRCVPHAALGEPAESRPEADRDRAPYRAAARRAAHLAHAGRRVGRDENGHAPVVRGVPGDVHDRGGGPGHRPDLGRWHGYQRRHQPLLRDGRRPVAAPRGRAGYTWRDADPPVTGRRRAGAPVTDPKLGFGAWVVLPPMTKPRTSARSPKRSSAPCRARRCSSSTTTRLDGTGRLADELAESDPRVRVRHRKAKQGLGRAYLDGFRHGARWRCRCRHPDGRRLQPRPRRSPVADRADRRRAGGPGDRVALRRGRRHGRLGHRPAGHLARRQHLRADAPAARAARSHRRLQGVARRQLAAVPFEGIHAGGYVFQIETTFRASRAGARVREVPIVFHDRRIGQSKMSRRILVEALFIVVGLWWEELRGRFRRRPEEAIRGMSGEGRPLGQSAEPVEPISGMRVVLDARPLQEPDRAPATAAYLGGSARRLRRRTARRRVVRILPPVRPRGPNHALRAPGRRRSTARRPRACCVRRR